MNATQGLFTVHDPQVPEKATEDQMLRALWHHFAGRWATVPQVTVSPNDLLPASGLAVIGYDGPEPPNDGSDRRIDMLLGRRAPNPGKAGAYETLAVEVKVSRADFLSDVRNPAKQDAWRKAATRHVYAVPAGLVHADEVPEHSGLLWVHGAADPNPWKREVKWVRKAPYIAGHRPQPPVRVLNGLMHRLMRLEAEVRGWTGGSDALAETPDELRARLQAAEKRAADLQRRHDAAVERAGAWQAAYAIAAGDGLPCRICGEPIRPLRPTRHWFAKWRHVNTDADAPCQMIDARHRAEAAQAEYAAADTATRERRLRAA
ncbi:MAG: hypothetical protein HOV66_19730, partial [Streptomycetaceae bacterium]|nr:hypothetical protein [Streptomycetaceae bacterium]